MGIEKWSLYKTEEHSHLVCLKEKWETEKKQYSLLNSKSIQNYHKSIW